MMEIRGEAQNDAHQGWGVLSLPDLLLPSHDGAGETAGDTRAPPCSL